CLFWFDTQWMLWYVGVIAFLVLVQYVCFFFFSSRRRHTRLVSDWSSDVCSSDLLCASQAPPAATSSRRKVDASTGPSTLPEPCRSEERRVGKECRSRWAAYR